MRYSFESHRRYHHQPPPHYPVCSSPVRARYRRICGTCNTPHVLTLPSAEYLKTLVDEIYSVGNHEGDMSFHSSLDTRGSGKLYTIQTAMGIRRPVEMVSSTYGLTKARRAFHDALFHPFQIDDRERYLMKLKPAHRLTLLRFWETGVLAPVFSNTISFNQPNRYISFLFPISWS